MATPSIPLIQPNTPPGYLAEAFVGGASVGVRRAEIAAREAHARLEADLRIRELDARERLATQEAADKVDLLLMQLDGAREERSADIAAKKELSALEFDYRRRLQEESPDNVLADIRRDQNDAMESLTKMLRSGKTVRDAEVKALIPRVLAGTQGLAEWINLQGYSADMPNVGNPGTLDGHLAEAGGDRALAARLAAQYNEAEGRFEGARMAVDVAARNPSVSPDTRKELDQANALLAISAGQLNTLRQRYGEDLIGIEDLPNPKTLGEQEVEAAKEAERLEKLKPGRFTRAMDYLKNRYSDLSAIPPQRGTSGDLLGQAMASGYGALISTLQRSRGTDTNAPAAAAVPAPTTVASNVSFRLLSAPTTNRSITMQRTNGTYRFSR